MNNKIKLVLFLVGCSLSGFSQTGKITGKLNLQDLENKNTVIENTFAIINSKTISDSIKIDKDLSFKFENLPADSFELSILPSSHPYNNRYIIHLKAGETENITIPYWSICPYEKTKDGICPICKKKDEVIPIRYGLITSKIEKKKKPTKRKYYPGGCLIFNCQASWFCEGKERLHVEFVVAKDVDLCRSYVVGFSL